MFHAPDLEEVRRRAIESAHEIARHLNAARAFDFETAARNRALQNDARNIPAPKVPMAVEPNFLQGGFGFELIETTRPVSTLDPDSLLPVIPSDEGGLSVDLGKPLRVDGYGNPVEGWYQIASTCKKFPGMTTEHGGRRYVFMVGGVFGQAKWWQDIGPVR